MDQRARGGLAIVILGLIGAVNVGLGTVDSVVDDAPWWKVLVKIVVMICLLVAAVGGYRRWKRPPAEH